MSLKALSLHLKYLKLFGPYLISFDKNTCVLSCSNKKNLIKYNLSNGLLLCFSIIIWAQLWQNRNLVPKVMTYEGMIPASSGIVFSICGFVYFKKSDAITELFNLMVGFEKQNLEFKRLVSFQDGDTNTLHSSN